MPSTLPETCNILNLLEKRGLKQATLLVVPGKKWVGKEIDMLHDFQNQGHELAGHGWAHCVQRRKTLYHQLHGLFLSRRVAEHLSLSEKEIFRLVKKCYNWFVDHDLNPPSLYVPPAWAMGNIHRDRLASLPFTRYEYPSGVYDTTENRFRQMALLGYEADTHWRRQALRFNNMINMQYAKWVRICRVAIHPYDLNLPMRSDLEHLLTTLG
jgi:hypothetical protein